MNARHSVRSIPWAVALLLWGGPAPAAGAGFIESIRGHADPQLASATSTILGLSFRQGHLQVDLSSGSAALVTVAGRPAGLFFRGEGRFSYASSDSIEIPVMSFNLRKATGLSPESSGSTLRVSDSFREALILVAGRDLPDLPPPTTGALPLAASFAEHRGKFLRAALAPASHLFLMQEIDAPATPLVQVELAGGQEDLVYLFDGILSRSEWLWSLRKSESADADLRAHLWPVILSGQAIGRDPRDPLPSRLDLTEVDYTLTATAGDDAALRITETLVPQVAQSVLRLDMNSTTFAREGVGSRSIISRVFRVKSVTDSSGAPLPFHHEHDELIVGLPEPAPAGQAVKLGFEIEGNFLIHPDGDNYWLLGTEPWFPRPELAGQRYSVRAVVKAKKPWTPLASGVTVSRREEGDYNVLESRIEEPVSAAVAMAGNYQLQETTRDGLTIRVASYAGKKTIAMKELTDLAFGIIEYYQTFLGPFPFKEYQIIQIHDYGWGQAPPATMFITNEAFDSRLDYWAFVFTQGINERIAHEIAHQYWGHVVKMPSWEEQWIEEAFAEYCAALFLRHRIGKVEYNAALDGWKTNARSAREASTIPLAGRIANPINPDDAFRKRFYLIYHKGAWLLSRLHAELGDQTFLTFLKSYQKSFRWKFGSTRHVSGLLQFMTKQDYTPFLQENYWGTGMPD